jgi:hypothetical protein
MVIFAAIMLAVAWHGLNVLSWTALAAGLATVLLAAEGVHLALSDRTGPFLGDGHPASSLGQLPAIAIMVGYGAAFALRHPRLHPRCSHRAGLVAIAVAGTAIAILHFADWMIPYLTAMALAAPCLIGVLWLDEVRASPDGAGLPPARDLGVGRRCRGRRRASRHGLPLRAPRRAGHRGGDRGHTMAHGTPAPAERHCARPDLTRSTRFQVRAWRCRRAC